MKACGPAIRAVAACAAALVVCLPNNPAAADPRAIPLSACGTPLAPDEVHAIVTLSDPAAPQPESTLGRLNDAVARHSRITDILVGHKDRRGLFALGLDAVEEVAVLPIQNDPAAFEDPEWAHAVSLELLDRFLRNVHAQFTGEPTEPQWTRYFDLAQDCVAPPAQVAMAGYNAHLTIDLPRSVAATGARPTNAPDYFRLVDAIATEGLVVIDRTRAQYGTDLGPLWQLYVVGDTLDQIVGEGNGSALVLRVGDGAFNAVVFANGLALQDPVLAGPAAGEIDAMWRLGDAAIETAARVGGL